MAVVALQLAPGLAAQHPLRCGVVGGGAIAQRPGLVRAPAEGDVRRGDGAGVGGPDTDLPELASARDLDREVGRTGGVAAELALEVPAPAVRHVVGGDAAGEAV